MSKYSGIFAITSVMQNLAAGKWYGRPCSPTIGTATVTANTASITFTPSANTNGSTVISYTAISNTGISNTNTTSPVSVTGLTKNTAYTFTVVTNSTLGSSASSSATNSIVAQGVPNAPTIGFATISGTTASITFTAPACNGANTITGYTAVANTGGFSGTNTTSPISVSGLTGGAAYTFIVYATNGIGNSANSSSSNSVFAAAAPGAPTIGAATSLSCSTASIAFTAPACNGGYTIDLYQATSTPGNFTATGASSPITVSGLNSCTSYTFKVRAHNSIGYGANSSSSSSVTTSNTRYYYGTTGHQLACSGGQFLPRLASAIAVDSSKNNYIVDTSPNGSICSETASTQNYTNVFKTTTDGTISWSKKLVGFPDSGGQSKFQHTGALTTDPTGNVYIGWRQTSTSNEHGIYKVNSSDGTVISGFGNINLYSGGSTVSCISVVGCTVFMYGNNGCNSGNRSGFLARGCLSGISYYRTGLSRCGGRCCDALGTGGVAISSDGTKAYVAVSYSGGSTTNYAPAAFIASIPLTGCSINPQNSTYWSGLYRASGGATGASGLCATNTYAPKRIKLDSSNNIYVSADMSSYGPAVPGSLYGCHYQPQLSSVMKLNSAGSAQWISAMYSCSSRSYAGLSEFDMLVDPSGNSYLYTTVVYNATGGYMFEIIISKFNSSGVLQWQRFISQTNGDYNSSKFNAQQYPSVKMAFADAAQKEIRIVIPVETFKRGIYITIPTDGSKTFQSPYINGYYINVTTYSTMDGYYAIPVSFSPSRITDGAMRVGWQGPFSYGTRAAYLCSTASPQTCWRRW